jgi:hypothetical protein
VQYELPKDFMHPPLQSFTMSQWVYTPEQPEHAVGKLFIFFLICSPFRHNHFYPFTPLAATKWAGGGLSMVREAQA